MSSDQVRFWGQNELWRSFQISELLGVWNCRQEITGSINFHLLSTYYVQGTVLSTSPLAKPFDGRYYIIPILQSSKLRHRAGKCQSWLQTSCALLWGGSWWGYCWATTAYSQGPSGPQGSRLLGPDGRAENEPGNFGPCSLVPPVQRSQVQCPPGTMEVT